MIDYIKRVASATDKQFRRLLPNAVPFYHLDDTLELGYKDSGGTVRRLLTKDGTQVLTNKTLTAPLFTGLEQENVASGGAGAIVTIVKKATALADATATDFDVACVVTVPNANHAASLQIELHASLGDQDSAQASFFTVGICRIAGAAAKATVSAIGNAGLATGASGNAAGLITAVVAGAVGAVNTINIKVTVTRSAGAATNHDALARISLLNIKATGVTIA